MKLIRLEAIDFKRLSAVAIDADTQKPIVLTGDNAQGKTSVLDAVQWALSRNGVEQPVRLGAESTTVAVKLANDNRTYVVKRRQKGSNAYLDITADDGSKMPSPQKFLDGLVGSLAFDPEAFTRLKPKEQAEALRQAVGLDTSDLDEAYKMAYAQRTEANRVKEAAEKVYKACPVVAGSPLEPKDAAAIVKQRDALMAELEARDTANDAVLDTRDKIDTTKLAIKALEAKLASARAELDMHETDLEALVEALDKREQATAGNAEKIKELETELAGITEHNASIAHHNRAIEDRKAKEEAYRTALKRSTDLDAEVKRIQSEKEARIAAAKFPVPGLAIENDTVLVNGVPFSDLNTAERIKVSCLIAMSQNPGLKVIFVREGALVSRANLALLADLAEQHDCAVWIEKFSETPEENSIHLEDGHISYVNGKPAPVEQLQLV
jgi:DNA repair exonuclease SbcCD ATPase subunit